MDVNMGFYAGLDVGGTSGRVKFCDENHRVIGEYAGEGCAFNTEGAVTGKIKYTKLMDEAMGRFGLKAVDCLGLCAAASGLDSELQVNDLRKIFTEMGFPGGKLLLVNDCELFLYLSEGPVLVVISGTGSICYGRSADGQVFRTGGWNHVLSDEGSAYYIGLQTFRAFAEHMDKRVSCPLIFAAVREKTGVETLEEADRYVNDHLLDKSPVGALALICAEAAARGEKAAQEILEDAADRVFCLIRDTARKMAGRIGDDAGLSKIEADLWLWGSVNVKNIAFRDILTEKLKTVLPGLTVGIPENTALDIALNTACRQFSAEL